MSGSSEAPPAAGSAGPSPAPGADPLAPPAPASPRAPLARLAATLLVFATYLALSAVWSWPTARLDPNVLVTRQFDLFPTIWLLDAAHAEPFALASTWSAWPVGENLTRVDSYVILPIAWALGGLLDARVIAGLLAWVGPALSALAAERCAFHAFRVPRPASWVAGVVYGFSGITATALLEGHVYHAFQPWLPLLLWAAWRSQDPDGRWYHGFAAAAAWALCLFTTAYAGVLGALLLVVVALRGGIARLFLGMVVVGLPAGLAYLHLFGAGGGVAGDLVEPSQILAMGSATLATLGGWGDFVDLRYHSIGAPVGWTGFLAMLLAPVVLAGRGKWRTLLGLALLALFVSFGRYIRLTPGGAPLGSPLAYLVDVPGIEYFRFPVRVTWLYALCAGIVAARVVAALGERLSPKLLAPLVLLFAGDAVFGTGLPWRLRRQIGETPSAYAAVPAGAVVLDLWPRGIDHSSGELEMRTRGLGCYYQAVRGHRTLETCIGTNVVSPREVVDRWVVTRLLRAEDPPVDFVRERLGQLGVGAVALHEDLYAPGARLSLDEALTGAFGEPVARSTDGGERVALWRVPALTETDPAAAWEAIRADR